VAVQDQLIMTPTPCIAATCIEVMKGLAGETFIYHSTHRHSLVVLLFEQERDLSNSITTMNLRSLRDCMTRFPRDDAGRISAIHAWTFR